MIKIIKQEAQNCLTRQEPVLLRPLPGHVLQCDLCGDRLEPIEAVAVDQVAEGTHPVPKVLRIRLFWFWFWFVEG